MVIDVFCHHVSQPILEKVRRVREAKPVGASGPRIIRCPVQNADPEVRLSLMAKYGVDMQALSLTTELLDDFSPDEAREICRVSNDANYALCKAYPDKFVNICALSLLDVKGALAELQRGIDQLDCRAAIVSTNQKGKGLDSHDYYPFYEKLTEHDLPLLLHPTYWKSYPLAEESEWTLMSRFGWPFDSTQAVWRLIFGGVLDRFPTLKIVMHHMGAMFPFFAGRFESGMMRLKEKPPRPFSEYWNNIYGDSAISAGSPEAYACGYAFFGPKRIVFGSDYPFGAEDGEKHIRGNLAGLKSLNITDDDMRQILEGNAKRLLKIK
ncbi:MAG TPA: amidohydrolase family protein [Syntrophorhabdales bacterium]|nr:amidohydrolase family protein [Syntrophorhabdales bacterium]